MISTKVCGIGLKEEDKWNDIQDKLVDTMLRFEKALKPYIAKLD